MAEVAQLTDLPPSYLPEIDARNGKSYMTGIGHGLLIGVRGNCATISDLDCISMKYQQALRCKHPNKAIGLRI